jgi:hypothetical protein
MLSKTNEQPEIAKVPASWRMLATTITAAAIALLLVPMVQHIFFFELSPVGVDGQCCCGRNGTGGTSAGREYFIIFFDFRIYKIN